MQPIRDSATMIGQCYLLITLPVWIFLLYFYPRNSDCTIGLHVFSIA